MKRGRPDPAAVLIVLATAVVVLPRLAQSLTAAKYRIAVSDAPPTSGLAQLTERAVTAAFLGWCGLVLLRRAGRWPADRRPALLALLAPWVYLVCRDLYADTRPRPATLLYPAAVLAVWVLRPGLDRLALLGWLVGAVAAGSIALAAVDPSAGLFNNVSGELLAPDKQLLPWGILVGPFSDGNNLGQFLALGLPSVLLVRRPGWRVLLAGVTVFALVFTSARSSLAAVAVAAGAVGLVLAVRGIARGVVAGLGLAGLAAVAVLTPMWRQGDGDFDNRGFIWRISLREWAADPVWGLGSRWYATIGQYANALGGNAFHGHNQFVQTVVTGGLVLLGLTGTMLAVLATAAVRGALAGRVFGVGYLAAFAVSATLEVSFGTVDRGFVFAVTALPMAVLAFAPRPAPRRAPARPVPRAAAPPPGSASGAVSPVRSAPRPG